MTDLNKKIEKIISKNCQIGYGFDDKATVDHILSTVYEHLEKKIEKSRKSENPEKIAEEMLKHPIKGFDGKDNYYPHPWVWHRVEGFNQALSEIKQLLKKELLK